MIIPLCALCCCLTIIGIYALWYFSISEPSPPLMEEEGDLCQFLDAQQEVGGQQVGCSSQSSDRSSRGCTPPLSSLSWPRRIKKKKSKSRPESPVVRNEPQSPSSRSMSKFSDGSSSSKSNKSKKKSKLSLGAASVGSPNTSNSSCAFSVSPPSCQSSAPTPSPSISKASNYPSTSSFTSSHHGSERRKKKSWMSNALSPTYRQRCDDLRKNFPGIPSNEVLVGDYSCALQKDILVHGRVYITTNYLCFYANIFRWETAVIIPWKQVFLCSRGEIFHIRFPDFR